MHFRLALKLLHCLPSNTAELKLTQATKIVNEEYDFIRPIVFKRHERAIRVGGRSNKFKELLDEGMERWDRGEAGET